MDVGRGPVQLALKPDGGEIFVVNSLSNSISEVITGTNDVQGAYMMGDNPVSGLVSRDNALLYVGNLRTQNVIVYSINDGRRVASVHVGDGPSAMAFSAEGNLLFVVDARSNDVAVVRTASSSLFTLFPAGRNPNAIVDKAFKLALALLLPPPRHAELRPRKQNQPRNIRPEQQPHRNIKRPIQDPPDPDAAESPSKAYFAISQMMPVTTAVRKTGRHGTLRLGKSQ